MLTLAEDPPQWGNVVLLVDEEEIGHQWMAVMLPRLLAQLTEIQRHVLARIAVHTWNHGGAIPFYAPTAQQRTVAFSLTDPTVGLVVPLVSPRHRLFFQLTQLGDVVAQQVFNVQPSVVVERREVTYNRLCVLMRNEWELDDAGLNTPPRRPRLKRVR